jgi:hypothetical protein
MSNFVTEASRAITMACPVAAGPKAASPMIGAMFANIHAKVAAASDMMSLVNFAMRAESVGVWHLADAGPGEVDVSF